jgi:outer membrane protein TolC
VKYQVNVPENMTLTLTDTLNSPSLSQLQAESNAGANSRTELKQLVLKQEGIKLELSKTKQAALPSLSLYGNYSKQFTYTNLDYSLGRWWSSFNYVGLQLRMPITSNFKNYNVIEERKIKGLQAELDLKQKVSDINYEVQKAKTEITNAQQNMQTTKSNYELSQVIYNNQKQQFGLGTRQYTDLLETNRSLSLAEQNYIKSVYDYLIASVNYQKAVGNF